VDVEEAGWEVQKKEGQKAGQKARQMGWSWRWCIYKGRDGGRRSLLRA
jgi:hypothetical protein